MPSDAPAIKRARVAADGAEIVVVGTASDERQAAAERIAAERGLAIIPPYDDDRVIAGQGTVGLEIAEALPDVGAVLVPIGGGGLASGVVCRDPGAGPGRAGDRRRAGARRGRAGVAGGRPDRPWSAADVSRTIADGTRTRALGRRTFAHLSALLDAVVTVSEAEIAAAVRLAAEESRLVVEPSGALSVAALAFRAAEAGLDRLEGGLSSPSCRAATSIRRSTSSTSEPRSLHAADARGWPFGSRGLVLPFFSDQSNTRAQVWLRRGLRDGPPRTDLRASSVNRPRDAREPRKRGRGRPSCSVDPKTAGSGAAAGPRGRQRGRPSPGGAAGGPPARSAAAASGWLSAGHVPRPAARPIASPAFGSRLGRHPHRARSVPCPAPRDASTRRGSRRSPR